MILSLGGGRNRLAIAAAALLLTGLAACSSDFEDVTPLATTSAPPTPTSTTDADEQAVIDLYTRYSEVVVAAENTATFDPADLEGVAQGAFVDEFAAKINYYESVELVRQGAPEYKDYEVSVDGDVATVTVCYNEDDWKPEGVEQPVRGFVPIGAQATRRDGSWIISSTLKADTITRTCA